MTSTTENLKLDSETSDDELKVLELQRAKRIKKKIVAKINSNIAVQPVEISNYKIFCIVLIFWIIFIFKHHSYR